MNLSTDNLLQNIKYITPQVNYVICGLIHIIFWKVDSILKYKESLLSREIIMILLLERYGFFPDGHNFLTKLFHKPTLSLFMTYLSKYPWTKMLESLLKA